MNVDSNPISLSYEYLGYGAIIEMSYTIPGAAGPDHLIIRISRLGKLEHTMQVSSGYGSINEALEVAQGLVRHYVSSVPSKAS